MKNFIKFLRLTVSVTMVAGILAPAFPTPAYATHGGDGPEPTSGGGSSGGGGGASSPAPTVSGVDLIFVGNPPQITEQGLTDFMVRNDGDQPVEDFFTLAVDWVDANQNRVGDGVTFVDFDGMGADTDVTISNDTVANNFVRDIPGDAVSLRLVVDSNGAVGDVDEVNENNNTLLIELPANGMDLTIGGDALQVTVNQGLSPFTVSNVGRIGTPDFFSLAIDWVDGNQNRVSAGGVTFIDFENGLAAGASQEIRIDPAHPLFGFVTNTPDGAMFLRLVADSNGAAGSVNEANEDNNTVLVQAPEMPSGGSDLSDLTVSSASYNPDTRMLTASVQNIGAVATEREVIVTGVFEAENGQPMGDILLGTVNAGFSPSDPEKIFEFNLGGVLQEVVRVVVRVDSASDEQESNEENNTMTVPLSSDTEPVSSDASLSGQSAVTVNGEVRPLQFTDVDGSLVADLGTVPSAVETIIVSPVTNDPAARVGVGETEPNEEGQVTVNLSEGDNVISISVLAEDQITVREYTIRVVRLFGALPDLTVDNSSVEALTGVVVVRVENRSEVAMEGETDVALEWRNDAGDDLGVRTYMVTGLAADAEFVIREVVVPDGATSARIFVDAQNRIEEGNEGNNSVDLPLSIVPPQIPNFVIEEFIAINGGIFVVVDNEGNADAARESSLSFEWLDEEGDALMQSLRQAIPPLTIGNEVVMLFAEDMLGGFFQGRPENATRLRVIIDASNDVEESDETDNASVIGGLFDFESDTFARSDRLIWRIMNDGVEEVTELPLQFEWVDADGNLLAPSQRITLSTDDRMDRVRALAGGALPFVANDETLLNALVELFEHTFDSAVETDIVIDANAMPEGALLRLTIDPENVIPERNEGNNVLLVNPVRRPYLLNFTENVTGDILPAVRPDRRQYTLQATNAEAQMTLMPVANTSTAIVMIDGEVVAAGQGVTRELAFGETTIIITVSQEGDAFEDSYRLVVTRAGAEENPPEEDDGEEDEDGDGNDPGDGDNNNNQNNQNQNGNPGTPIVQGGGGGGGSPSAVSAANIPLRLNPGQEGTLLYNFGTSGNTAAVQVTIPQGAITQTTVFTMTEQALTNARRPQGTALFHVGGRTFSVEAVNTNNQLVTNFGANLSFSFTLDALTDVASGKTGVYFFDPAQNAWVRVDNVVRDRNTVRFSLNHLTSFAVFVGVEDLPELVSANAPAAPQPVQQVLGTRVVSCLLESGKPYKHAGSRAVYYVTSSCTKRPFVSSNVYFTYFSSWYEVSTIEKSMLDSIPNDMLGFMPWGPKYMPASGILVKSVSDPKIYLVLGKKNKHWIASPEIAAGLGYDIDRTVDVDAQVLEKYTNTESITSVDARPAFSLIKYRNSPKVYQLLPGIGAGTLMKVYIPDEKTLVSLGYDIEWIPEAADTEVYPDGSGNSSSAS